MVRLTGTERSGRLMDTADRDALACSQHQGTSARRSAAALPQKPDLSGRCKTFSNVPGADLRDAGVADLRAACCRGKTASSSPRHSPAKLTRATAPEQRRQAAAVSRKIIPPIARVAMKDLRADWRRWIRAESIVAVLIALGMTGLVPALLLLGEG